MSDNMLWNESLTPAKKLSVNNVPSCQQMNIRRISSGHALFVVKKTVCTTIHFQGTGHREETDIVLCCVIALCFSDVAYNSITWPLHGIER